MRCEPSRTSRAVPPSGVSRRRPPGTFPDWRVAGAFVLGGLAWVYVPLLVDLASADPDPAAVAAQPAPTLEIFANPIVASGEKFVASLDVVGCSNRPPAVSWSAPGCSIEGAGSTVYLTCSGSVGSSVKISAAATAGRPPACNGSGSTSVAIGGATGSAAIPRCGSPTVPIFAGVAEGRVGTVRLQVAECLEAPAGACPPVDGSTPNSTELKARLAAALPLAPSGLRDLVSAAEALADPAGAFAGVASLVRCASPAAPPRDPGAVRAPEVRAWLLGTVLAEGPASGLRPILAAMPDDALLYAYRRLVEARRNLKPGSLG